MGSIGYRYLCCFFTEPLASVFEQSPPLGCQIGSSALCWVVLLDLLAGHIDAEFLLNAL